MIVSAAYHVLPDEFYIGNTYFEKHSNFLNIGFKVEITHEQVQKLKRNDEGRAGIAKIITGGASVATALSGSAVAAPIGGIVAVLVGLIQLYIQWIKNKDKGNGVYFIFFIGGLAPIPIVKSR